MTRQSPVRERNVVDVNTKLDELRRMVEEARPVPMSASVVMNRDAILESIEEVAAEVETTVAESRRVLDEREAVVRDGRREAERLVSDAHREREKLVSDTDVFRVAQREADSMLARSKADAESMRRETDQYVDAKLANFEVTLQRTSEAVKRGRARLKPAEGPDRRPGKRPAEGRA
jgi:cell division septum initiation protein DivIVA